MSGLTVRKEPFEKDIPKIERKGIASPAESADPQYEVLRLQAILEQERRQREELHRQNKNLQKRVKSLTEGRNKAVQLSYRDSLTGLYNRRFFTQRLKEETSRSNRYNYQLTCLLLDIDYFKSINDNFGHTTGDVVLKKFADKLKQCVRDVDILARYGGEEFVVVLPHTKREHGVVLAERIRKKIEQGIFEFNGNKVDVTVSIGVASLEYPSIGNEQQLIEQADQALYQAKRTGRNRVVAYRES